uniref:MADS-box transcription factor PHERES 1-like n=1 Tax=Erigeron canadensis TaxID=72917 RepID=UPI001CB9A9C8|nr:MADS-box transcription factor PHERES 1-like [Erigeron canadensis]
MTRKKVKLAFITNDSARKATFKKRKKGLMKKVNELSTLCGIDACAIIYSPYEAQPEVWPNNIGVQRVLTQFKRMPEMEQSKKMVNQESFIRQRITKANDQLKKQIKENREKEMTEVMYQCLTGKGSIANLILPDLNDLGGMVDQTLKDICRRIESLKKAVPGKAVAAPPPSQPPRRRSTVVGTSSSTANEMMTRGLGTSSSAANEMMTRGLGTSSSAANDMMTRGLGTSSSAANDMMTRGLGTSSNAANEMMTRGLGTSSSAANEMMTRGLTMHALEKRPMVDHNLNAMDGMQKTQWFTDWMNNPSEHNLGLAPGYDMTSFADNQNPIWPNTYFP